MELLELNLPDELVFGQMRAQLCHDGKAAPELAFGGDDDDVHIGMRAAQRAVAQTVLVAKVPHAGKDHGNAVLIRCLDDLLVAHGAARLDHRGHADFRCLI